MKHLNSRQSGQILWIAMIILSAVPVYGYLTPWMHTPEFDGGWGLLDPSTWPRSRLRPLEPDRFSHPDKRSWLSERFRRSNIRKNGDLAVVECTDPKTGKWVAGVAAPSWIVDQVFGRHDSHLDPPA
jgi:hypothetical protein